MRTVHCFVICINYWSVIFLFCRNGSLMVTSWEFIRLFLPETAIVFKKAARHNRQLKHNLNVACLQITRNQTSLSLLTAEVGTSFGWMCHMNSLQFLVGRRRERGASMFNTKVFQGLQRGLKRKRKSRKKSSVLTWWVLFPHSLSLCIARLIPWWDCETSDYFDLSHKIVKLV